MFLTSNLSNCGLREREVPLFFENFGEGEERRGEEEEEEEERNGYLEKEKG